MEPLFARTEHGGHKVVPLLRGPNQIRGLEIWWPEGPVQYPTNKRALIALFSQNPNPGPDFKDPNIPVDRYFRRGKYQRVLYPKYDVLDIFRPEENLAVPAPKNKPILKSSSEELAILPQGNRNPQLGIDLQNRGHEVRKLFYAGFARKVFARGHDPEEVLQELYKALLIRNRGKCPWDPNKSSFGHYVYMVAGCIISNYNRKIGRVQDREIYGVQDEEGESIDVAEADIASVGPDQENLVRFNASREELLGLILLEAPNRGIRKDLAQEVFYRMADFAKMRELKKDFPKEDLNPVVKLVQDIAKIWKTATGL